MRRALYRLGALLGAVLIALAVLATPAFSDAKPPDPVPKELKKRAGDRPIGINTDNGEYCVVGADNCRWPKDCEVPGQKACPKGGQSSDERTVDEWMKKNGADDPKSDKYKDNRRFLLKCLKEHDSLDPCVKRGDRKSLLEKWTAGKISEAASSALKETAGAIGNGVVWLVKQFANIFNKTSVITLSETGIGPMMGIMTGISALVATFLLLIQFGKLAVTQKGAPAVTAITGLAKWGVILAFYVTATQVALNWSDTVSTALINYTFNGGDGTSADASAAMKAQLTGAFAALIGGGGGTTAGVAVATGGAIVPAAIGFVIVIGILCFLAIAALWLEMQLRQAGIMILLVTMPLALAGQIADATNEWWPKARNALIALILMKPVIVLCFCIGFSSIEYSEGVGNVIVGLLIFLLACFAWPTLAKFMTFTTVGAGNSAASGMLSSIGSSVSSYFGQPTSGGGGAGGSGGGSGYTQALESENESGTEGGGSSWNRRLMGAQHQKGAGLWPNTKAAVKAAGPTVGMGMQVAAMGKDILESSAQNVAAHAGLDHAAQGGRHVITPDKDRGRGSEEQAPAPAPAPTQEQDPSPSPSPQPPQPSEPPPAPQPQSPEGD
ncbi:hypothetical protein [Streptomyces sp. NBC_01187]|uniref:hypothetical protein n=1 Tax=Streptomyces sp. NBC_01187 TaxID=2903766 RepID=UPI002F90A4AA|nr:hypothetical protein OG220_40240 [Streptomyces sp. NBC_01187]